MKSHVQTFQIQIVFRIDRITLTLNQSRHGKEFGKFCHILCLIPFIQDPVKTGMHVRHHAAITIGSVL